VTDSVQPLLEVRGLSVEYPGRRRRQAPNRAVEGVDLTIGPGETLGLVGESGSGKSTIGRALFGRVPIVAGNVRFDGADITFASASTRRALSGQMQMVFQNPYGSLNPSRTVGQTLAETLRPHHVPRSQVSERVAWALDRVGLPDDAGERYPSEFSGGQRQRIAIARALMTAPRLVVCDEPVSALDISIQAQVLNLLAELQRELGLSYLFISHDIAVVRNISDRLAVLYRGRIVEQGEVGALIDRPAHPYTRVLLDAAPVPDPAIQRARRARVTSAGSAASGTPQRNSCLFAVRCPHAQPICRERRPELRPAPDGRLIACHVASAERSLERTTT
jgi:oligopeptide/dipeptide ABC transporter ATP-binding protein